MAPLPHHNASVVVTVSTAIGVEIVLTSSTSAMVTPLVTNKTASLIKGINALEGNNLIVLLCTPPLYVDGFHFFRVLDTI